jgi:hypothetical protein
VGGDEAEDPAQHDGDQRAEEDANWTHVERWDVAAGSYEPGVWLHGRLYPQRCDLSPDGRYRP